jgi:hypothetical protein
MVKIGRGQQNYRRCRHCLPSEFCNDENNSVTRSAMDALRNSKKISLLAVAILYLYILFNLILDAPRTYRRTSLLRVNQNRGKNNYHKYKIMTGCLVCWRQVFNQLVVLQGLPGLEAGVSQLVVFQVEGLTWSGGRC